jgi:hypothetical protein
LPGNGIGAMAYSSCFASAITPHRCYLVTYPAVNTGTFEVTLFVLSTDGKTVLSPSETISVNL